MDVAYPWHIDAGGRTASAPRADHIRELIEQVLFTTPGERVNRPTFGSGLMQLVFSPNSSELATATQFLVQGALQQWLGDVIVVRNVDVRSEDAVITVTVDYLIRETQQPQAGRFVKAI
jgi:phage baseplate assembly protein W